METYEDNALPESILPNWSRDEAILLLDVYLALSKTSFSKKALELSKLSVSLRRLRPSVSLKNPKYRNINGVHMTLMNARSLDPAYNGKGVKSASRILRVTWDEFEKNTAELQSVARSIRKLISEGYDLEVNGSENNRYDAREGRLLTQLHSKRERNTTIVRELKRAHALNGTLVCAACDFDFNKTYGDRGYGYIEAHHNTPLF